ncbi:hypothetical protein QTP88_029335 [Uroleucon formosanum]
MEKSEKLFFPLCYNCAVDQNQRCDHSKNERQFIGTWTNDEVNKALEKGYIKTKMYEKVQNIIIVLIKEYIKIIFHKLGILLDKDKIEDNPSRRAVAKLCLNSLWGKFGQRQNMKKTDARLRLFEILDKLGRAVVYFNTDSIFYIDNCVNKIKTGTTLGEWTDELGENVHITVWASKGPKSYYYKTNDNKHKTVIKEFTLNNQNLLKLNGKSMIKLIEQKNKDNIELEYNQITRDTLTKNIVNKKVTKKFSFGYDKRIILPDYDTIPYGY